MGTPPHVDPVSAFPEFYTNTRIRSRLALQRLWTVSDFEKRPVDIVAALDTSPVCPRCNQPECNDVHGARVSDADTQLLTLDELTAALPTASNVATHLDSRSSGLIVLDIEPECPTEVADQLLRLVTGNTASPQPSALYSEVSGSGRGYHLVMPTPTNIAYFPRAAHAVKLQHPQRWYEVLLYHWITFSRTPIPPERLQAATLQPTGEMLTWEGVFGQLVEMAPGGGAAGDRAHGQFDQALAYAGADLELTAMEIEVAQTVIDHLSQEPTKDLHDDFGGDTSRWEMSRLVRIAAIADNKLHIRQSINRLTSAFAHTPEQDQHQLLRVVHHVARETLPPRAKHDERRAGASYLLKRCAEALDHLNT
ncbi:MAG: hypothetical protein DI630_00165 [Gordonia sp. (in: high G+C Gram-positive bacteria)]|nr:MAG: hypothetical protein DI630_00165 [Gordonia sp. (in: high G+C Gram-positive bacteria)]